MPTGADWIYEVKFDGYRAQAIKNGNAVKLLSRNEKPLHFPQVAAAVGQLAAESVVLDGEIVALDQRGRPSFQALQNPRFVGRGCPICLYAFDLLHLDGHSLRGVALETRKQMLAELVRGSLVRHSENFETEPELLLEQIREFQLEGIVAKRKGSSYEPGKRSSAWLKFKIHQQEDFFIGGFLPGNPIGSILVGYREARKLKFAGEVHGGLNRSNQKQVAAVLARVPTASCPFSNLPDRRLD